MDLSIKQPKYHKAAKNFLLHSRFHLQLPEPANGQCLNWPLAWSASKVKNVPGNQKVV